MNNRLPLEAPDTPDRHDQQYLDNLVRYYSEAGPDYAAWSKRFNMHFGFYRWPMNPLRLEPMLERMNREVLDRLALSPLEECRLLDMGCGLGATSRTAASHYPRAKLTGITIVPWQIQQARELTCAADLSERVHFLDADYTATLFSNQTFDGAYAVESSCYAGGETKASILREAYRVLKPGKRFVIADGFLKNDKPLNPLLRYCYRKICDCWSLETFGVLPSFLAAMKEVGFRDIRVEEISWQIAPSVFHIPRVTLWFLLKDVLFSRTKMTHKRWDNTIAPGLGIILGLARRRYGYYLISGER